ncbi:hypothetical protein ACHQM5_016647 [Ranunculus cassubicifolius]
MLPRDVKNIKSLRNLIITWELNTKLLISRMPAGMGQLTRLETLEVFVVNNASEGAAGIQELGRLNQLKGSLIIQDIRNLRDPRDAKEANMMTKDKLSSLILCWGSSEDGVIDAEAKEEEEAKKKSNQVLESLQPHLNLQLSTDSKPYLSPMFVYLRLLERYIISLTRLDLVNCPKLDLSAIEFQHLVSLKTLILQELHQLTSVPDGIQLVATLQTLYIRDCKNLKMLPEWLEQKLPRSLWYLEIRGCHSELHRSCEIDDGEDWHKISHLEVANIE